MPTTPALIPAHSDAAAATPGAGTDAVAQNIGEIVRLEQRDRLAMSRSDHIANWLAAWSGRVAFAVLHALFFAIWIAWNAGWLGLTPFDAYPFGLLTVIVSLEAIFLSTFVLISQNQQARQADRRAKVDLQVNLLAEQETTRILRLVTDLSERFDALVPREHPRQALHPLEAPTSIARVMDAIDQAETQLNPEGAKGPQSAADTGT